MLHRYSGTLDNRLTQKHFLIRYDIILPFHESKLRVFHGCWWGTNNGVAAGLSLQPFNQASGNPEKVHLRDNPDQLSVLDDRETADVVCTHDRHGFMYGSIWIDSDWLTIHDILGGGDLGFQTRIMAAQFEHMPQHVPERDEPYQLALRVLYWRIPDFPPVHHIDDEIQDIVLLNSKQVGGHKLTDLEPGWSVLFQVL